MGVALELSAAELKSFVAEAEYSQRLRRYPAEVVRKVLRYGGHVGSRIDCYRNLDRGMELARKQIADIEKKGGSFPSGSVILAGTLNRGKGRFERSWHAPIGGIWLTLVLANTLLSRYTSFLPMAAGVACCEALVAIGVEARLKWVNDVLVAGRKIAGILVESHPSPLLAEEFILIGIGVNINNQAFPEDLAASSVAASSVLGREISLHHFALTLLAKLVWNIGLLYYEEGVDLENSDEAPPSCMLLESWKGLSDTIGRRVLYGFDIQKKPQYEAVVEDVDQDGCLVMRLLEGGAVIREQSGEIIYLS